MTAAAWNAAATRTLRAADALLDRSGLRWVGAWRGFDDPGSVFDRLVQSALTVGTSASTVAEPPSAAADPRRPAQSPWPAPLFSGLAASMPTPMPMRLPIPAPRPVPIPLRQQAAAGPTAVAAAAASALRRPPDRPAVQPPGIQPAAAGSGAVSFSARGGSGLRGRAARMAPPARPAPISPSATPGSGPMSAPFGLTAGSSARTEPPSDAMRAAFAEGAGRDLPPTRPPLRLLDTRAPVPASPSTPPHRALPPGTTVPADAASRPVDPSTLADRAPPTRLVSGLPALQGLLRAAVADSQNRHAGSDTASRPIEAPMPPPASAAPGLPTLLTAPALRAWPQLDAVAEDMLVDRLADRLQDRLREQALRHFGFTGGLV